MKLALILLCTMICVAPAILPAPRLYDPYQPNAFLDRAVNLWDSMLIARFAADSRVTVIRIADVMHDRISPIDRFHPSAAGYATIAARIAQAF